MAVKQFLMLLQCEDSPDGHLVSSIWAVSEEAADRLREALGDSDRIDSLTPFNKPEQTVMMINKEFED